MQSKLQLEANSYYEMLSLLKKNNRKDIWTGPQNKETRRQESIRIKADIGEFEHTHKKVKLTTYSKNWFLEKSQNRHSCSSSSKKQSPHVQN